MSSSIANFKEKLRKRIGWPEWKWYWPFGKCVFFGCYHIGDFLRIICHRGERKIFWCGGDIVNLSKQSKFWKFVIRGIEAKHFCENESERDYQRKLGIECEVCPMIFDDPNLPISFEKSDITHIYVNSHKGREKEYGLYLIERIKKELPNVVFHVYDGSVSNEVFNEEIKQYHSALRLNEIDGFSEVVAKSVLMGQYPITRIPYENIWNYETEEELIMQIRRLQKMDKPNYSASIFWRNKFEESLCKIKG